MESLFNVARELADPTIWSAGVELARNADFQEEDSLQAGERVFRVIQGPRDRIHTVTLSPESELWQCDCGSDDDPCRHVVATILAARQGKSGRALVRSTTTLPATVVHSLSREGRYLAFRRFLVFDAQRQPVTTTLAQACAEAAKSRRGVSVSEEEARIDHLVPSRREGILDPTTMRRLIPALSRVSRLELDGVRVKASPEPLAVVVEIVDEPGGFRLRQVLEPDVTERFDNGVMIRAGVVSAVEDSTLSADELSLLSGEGTCFPAARSIELATRIVPHLAAKVHIRHLSPKLPRARRVAPRIVIETVADERGERLTVIPHLVYGDPIIAEVRGAELVPVNPREIPVRDPVEESRLVRDMNMRLQLRMNEAKVFAGPAALGVVQQLQGWSTRGSGMAVFTPATDVVASVSEGEEGFTFAFKTGDGRHATADDVLAAWRQGAGFARLTEGGWAALPHAWLVTHGDALARVIEARIDNKPTLTASLLPDVSELCDSLGVECPDYFAKLRQGLEHVDEIPEAELPGDLDATLRSYQRLGVNWLAFLKKHRLSALLADDMGLGKTLQTLCVVEGPSLVVCPTSVLSSWRDQIKRFRPGMRICVYHGPQRVLDEGADITLTSYAILRLDAELLSKVSWRTAVLDEAQTIRNPSSQVAQAAYRLQANFKISLSGTPLENSLEDLWSQFHFLNPGLLSTYSEFQSRFVDPVNSGDIEAAGRLRKRVSPFILRRLKRDVATELPPKTEVVLQCELEESERALYEAVRAGVRSEIVQKMNDGKGVFSVLEALLRLRQACCHPGLVPGHEASSSSKIRLLIDSVETSVSQGHRCLVFSQWTSLLDRIEPRLREAGISFCRIDGSTEGRGDVVESFQRDDGPHVMLLSLKAGGLGLTLTAADHVFIVDPWWNPAAEDQAADRAYRIGQNNPVIVHRLVAKDTIEERILELQARKRELLAAAVGDSGRLTLSRDDLLALLE